MEAFENYDFLNILRSAKTWSTICKNEILGGHNEFRGVLGGGSASRAVPVEALSRVVRILHDVPWQAGSGGSMG